MPLTLLHFAFHTGFLRLEPSQQALKMNLVRTVFAEGGTDQQNRVVTWAKSAAQLERLALVPSPMSSTALIFLLCHELFPYEQGNAIWPGEASLARLLSVSICKDL